MCAIYLSGQIWAEDKGELEYIGATCRLLKVGCMYLYVLWVQVHSAVLVILSVPGVSKELAKCPPFAHHGRGRAMSITRTRSTQL